ncbi:mRNA export factor-like [Zophobas morio]|uniref:mRNA export factor-like n=1 Tax=Zophobas morio TaxID=2755281 RepID=UPI0030836D66
MFLASKGYNPFANQNSTPFQVQGSSNSSLQFLFSPEEDTSSLSFCPGGPNAEPILCLTDWSGKINFLRLKDPNTVIFNLIYNAPILCHDWLNNESIATGSCDNIVSGWDLRSQKRFSLASHSQPVKVVKWSAELVDTRSSSVSKELNLEQKIFDADVKGNLLAVATSNRHIYVYDLRNMSGPLLQRYSILCHQSTCIAWSPTLEGYAVGGIDGRVGFQLVNAPKGSGSVLKAHRDDGRFKVGTNKSYACNDVKFHPATGTLATIGSNGYIHFWNLVSQKGTKHFEMQRNRDGSPAPVNRCCFSNCGQNFAFSLSYDFSEGPRHGDVERKIYWYRVNPSDVQ